MPTEPTYFRYTEFPPKAPPPAPTIDVLDRLENWRAGSTATSAVMAALLPFAISFHLRYPVAIATALLLAGVIALGCHLARQARLRTLLIYAEYGHLPALARKRRRLVSPGSRRTLARELRHAACPQPPRWLHSHTASLTCTVTPLADRVGAIRSQLLYAAAALEANPEPDPACVALIRELLRDGASPLYNPNIPLGDLNATLHRATFTLDSVSPSTTSRAERPHTASAPAGGTRSAMRDVALAASPNHLAPDEPQENEP